MYAREITSSYSYYKNNALDLPIWPKNLVIGDLGLESFRVTRHSLGMPPNNKYLGHYSIPPFSLSVLSLMRKNKTKYLIIQKI
jgi:hypothetical protein